MTSSSDLDGLERQLRQALGELERRIHAGDECRVEEFFAVYPPLAANGNTAIEMIYAEFAARREAGQAPVREEYYRRFPQWQAELRIQFEVDEKLGDALPDVREIRITGTDGKPELYHVLKEIWRSSNGNVDKAINVRRNRIDAVKTLVNGDAADVQRFRAGACEQARLRHDHILPVYLVGETDDGAPCFTMEFADGGSLAATIGHKPQPAAEAARLVKTLADAIAYAHAEGVFHRDLKPANIVLTAAGVPKITDFGLARRQDTLDGPSKTGDILGTPEYMAPEQAAGKTDAVGPLSDVYSLGAILYELLTGRPPFQGTTVVDALDKVVKKDPIRPRRLVRNLPRGLESICLKCLEKPPQRRYRTAQELADDLGRWLNNQRPAAHRLVARTDRIIRRNRQVSMATAIFLLFAVVTPVLAYTLSPERARERIERDLAAGKEVMLIGERGRPKWRHWAVSGTTHKDGITEDGFYWIEAADFSLVELVHDPQYPCFRISAEMRHEKSDSISAVMGVYFAHSTHSTERGLERCFLSVALNGFSDLRSLHQSNDPEKWDREKIGNPVSISVARLADPSVTDPNGGVRKSDVGHNAYVPVNSNDRGIWRKLELDVTPESIRFTVWRDSRVTSEMKSGSATGAQIVSLGKTLSAPEINPEFLPRSPVGVYLYKGRASFRNVTITGRSSIN